MNFTKEYWNFCFEPMLAGLAEGQTLNPDISCNANIKFGAFYERAVRELDADLIAFGHYAQVLFPFLIVD
jgi:tRNA U34 2-thiouridine synthase MnmA/TrmU